MPLKKARMIVEYKGTCMVKASVWISVAASHDSQIEHRYLVSSNTAMCVGEKWDVLKFMTTECHKFPREPICFEAYPHHKLLF